MCLAVRLITSIIPTTNFNPSVQDFFGSPKVISSCSVDVIFTSGDRLIALNLSSLNSYQHKFKTPYHRYHQSAQFSAKRIHVAECLQTIDRSPYDSNSNHPFSAASSGTANHEQPRIVSSETFSRLGNGCEDIETRSDHSSFQVESLV